MLPVAVARSLWRRIDKLCTSGFVDDVIFARKLTLIDVAAQLKRSAHAAIGVTSYGALGHVPPLELGHVKKIWQFLR